MIPTLGHQIINNAAAASSKCSHNVTHQDAMFLTLFTIILIVSISIWLYIENKKWR